MAFSQCCICGKNLGLFDKSIALSPNTPDLMACKDCSNAITLIKGPVISKENPMSRHEQQLAIHHIAEVIGNNEIDKATAEVILEELADKSIAEELKALSSNKKELAERAVETERRYLEESNSILTTTAYQFGGYRIVEYLGVYSGDCIIGTGISTDIMASFSDLIGEGSGPLVNKLKSAKSAAMHDLVKQAMLAGGNAIIAIQCSIYPFGSMLGVTISGTSVTIEKGNRAREY